VDKEKENDRNTELQNYRLHKLYSSQNVIRMIKYNGRDMGEMKKATKVLLKQELELMYCTMLGVLDQFQPPVVQLFHSGRRSDW
jgi:hypothetical protein